MGSRILISLLLTIAFASLICSVAAARDLAEPKTEGASFDGGSKFFNGGQDSGVDGSLGQYEASAYSRGGSSHHNGGGETYNAAAKGGGCSAAEAQALKASQVEPHARVLLPPIHPLFPPFHPSVLLPPIHPLFPPFHPSV